MIKKLNKTNFDKIYELMEISFPIDEYRTYDEQKALLDNPAYQIFTLQEDDTDGTRAFIAAWIFDEVVYIDHFAVNPKYRNGGIGAKMLKEFFEIMPQTVCLEVEEPNDEMAIRRIGFYERNNFFLNKYPYIQPPISKGRSPIPLMIMTSDRLVTEKEFENIKNILYTRVYKINDF